MCHDLGSERGEPRGDVGDLFPSGYGDNLFQPIHRALRTRGLPLTAGAYAGAFTPPKRSRAIAQCSGRAWSMPEEARLCNGVHCT